MDPPGSAIGPPIAAIDRGLGTLSERIRRAARRSYRFSWLSWGFVLSLPLSLVLYLVIGLSFAVTVTTTTVNGTMTTTTGPWWGVVGFLPSIVVLAFAIRELLVARREALRGETITTVSAALPASQSEGGWVAAVQQAQKTVTHMKNETEFSFVPLVLGSFTAGESAFGLLLSGSNLGAAEVLWVVIGALPVCLLVIPLYLLAREWIASYQTLLDRQVGELSRLEAEFLWRFTGTPA